MFFLVYGHPIIGILKHHDGYLASILHQPIPKKSRETDSPCFDAQGPLGFFEAHLQKRSRSRWGRPPAR